MRMSIEHKPDVPKWFYLRDPYYIEQVPSSERPNYQSEGEYEHKKLTEFKAELPKVRRSNYLGLPLSIVILYNSTIALLISPNYSWKILRHS